ncbi:uncharacterized protein [Dysidea avara]|uniref:uncharacterized protein n=1 Tax=Dysidea avara TaxID=196820 RepID=UPI00331F284F
MSFFETCIQNDCANLLEGIFADDSCIMGHVASLCEQDMSLVAMGLLRVAVSVLSPSSGTINIQNYETLCKLSMYPLMVYLRNDHLNLDCHKMVVLAVRQQVLENTEQILLSALKNVNCIIKEQFGSDCLLAMELCITLVGTCSGINTLPVVGSLSSSGRHKIITELLVILSQVYGDAPNHLTSPSVTEQFGNCLAELVKKRSLPLQVVCKGLYLIGQVLTTLLQTKVGVADSGSRCGLLSRIAESLQLCTMDVNWEIRDSYMELIGFMATEQVTDEVVQFLTTNKLCDLLVTRGLADDES